MTSISITQLLTMHGSDRPMFDLISIVNFCLGSADSSTVEYIHPVMLTRAATSRPRPDEARPRPQILI
jgi:hypothetical protein